MPGVIKSMLDRIVEARAKGNQAIRYSTITKLNLKGIAPAKFTASSPDDPAVIARVRAIAAELGVSI
jgi:hypothetical protein